MRRRTTPPCFSASCLALPPVTACFFVATLLNDLRFAHGSSLLSKWKMEGPAVALPRARLRHEASLVAVGATAAAAAAPAEALPQFRSCTSAEWRSSLRWGSRQRPSPSQRQDQHQHQHQRQVGKGDGRSGRHRESACHSDGSAPPSLPRKTAATMTAWPQGVQWLLQLACSWWPCEAPCWRIDGHLHSPPS